MKNLGPRLFSAQRDFKKMARTKTRTPEEERKFELDIRRLRLAVGVRGTIRALGISPGTYYAAIRRMEERGIELPELPEWRKRHRKREISEERKREAVGKAREGGSSYEAAGRMFGVSSATIRRWEKELYPGDELVVVDQESLQRHLASAFLARGRSLKLQPLAKEAGISCTTVKRLLYGRGVQRTHVRVLRRLAEVAGVHVEAFILRDSEE